MTAHLTKPQIQAAIVTRKPLDVRHGAVGAELGGTAGVHPTQKRLDQAVEHLGTEPGDHQISDGRVGAG